ncbi:MAG: caspase family protein [Sulfuritalea sp.]|nr:caspase family protein [Sulfuritalea sp.]
MTSRRRFIQTLAALPPAFAFRHARAAADPSRLALIIGNSSYRDAPLINPVNDAKAVTGLFTQAGFTVDSHLNATRSDMMAAIERFGAAVKRSDTRLVVFYYAGHGAQLDWRNYLLPVDAVVEKQEDMKQRCVDLGLLLGQFSAAKDKTFVVILDACRNNPFGAAYRPEQKGLSQFDAPVGSLLAYATSPGNVASDGDGQNGLYTENLVRELGKRNTRIEDALKRVRLNVRLASHGEQIPWETTSLEGDVFIFNEGQKKLTEAEMDQAVEADITEWTRIKSSKNTDDWVGYLRAFPNGRFAEIAQMRMTRLLAEDEKRAAEKRQREAQERQEAAARADKLAAEKRQQEEQKRIEQERIERERIRLAEAQRLAAERKQLEEQQLQETRRREEEQQRIEAKRRQEQERLDRERQRIAEAERLAEERRKQEEQRQAAEQKRIELAAAQRQKEEQRVQDEQKRLSEQKRLDEERMERERIRVAEAQRLAAERKQLEEQQLQEQRRRQEEQQSLDAKRRQEQERLDRERQRIAEAERLAAEHKQQEEQRQLAEQKRIEQQKLEREPRDRAETARLTTAPAPMQTATPAPALPAAAATSASTGLPKSTAAASSPRPAPPIEIGEGAAVPKLIALSANPFSAGRYPLNRIFTVGDAATIRQSDLLTGIEEQMQRIRVTKVDYDEDRVEFNQGAAITDLMGNFIKQGPNEFDSPVQFTPAEFQVGKKWTAAFHRSKNDKTSNIFFDMQIVKRETITVPAGTFDTFRIEGEGWNITRGNRREVKFWLVPNLNFPVRSESVTRNKRGQFVKTERRELVAMRQHTIAS